MNACVGKKYVGQKYVAQKAEDLVYFATKGAPNAKFDIFAEGAANQDGNKINAAVIGASHYVTFDVWGQKFTEILACVHLDSAKEQIITQTNFIFAPAGNMNLVFKNVHYNFQWRIYPWEKGVNELFGLQNLAVKKRNEKNYIILNPEFPREEGMQLPQTLVVVGIDEQTITCNTIHTYPEKTIEGGKIVSTMSSIERKTFSISSKAH